MCRSLENLGLCPDLSRLPEEVRNLIQHGGFREYPHRSEAGVAVCAAMFRAGYNVAEVWMVMTDPANGISEEFFEEDGELAEVHLELLISEIHYADRQQERREAQARGHVTRSP